MNPPHCERPPLASRVVLPFPGGPVLSPSLARTADGAPAYELKFLLPKARAERVEGWARRHLAFDPHADPARGYAYRVHTVYLDTPRLDVFGRAPSHRRHKFRLRRYGAESFVFLERKSKTGDRVTKWRTRVADVELTWLDDLPADPGWAGHWFRRRLRMRGLRPTCQVSYDRVAHVGADPAGPLRLTLDYRVRCAPADGWQPDEPRAGQPALADEVIVELKYRSALPALFQLLLAEVGLSPSPASKYRLGVRTWGLDAGTWEVD
jgi:hypothetical protein